MNGKRAKALRRAAEQKTVGQPAVDFDQLQPVRIFANPAGVPMGKGGPSVEWLGQRRLTANCTRAVYQSLKQQAA